jgi:DNA modification methylase
LNVKQAGEIMENDASRSSDRLKLESWPVERLIPSVHNARSHSPTQVAEIAGSIRAFGFSNPILVSPEGDIIAGHGRLAAARQLALAEVPVIVLSGLNDLQKRQLLLADNRIALNATWDMQALQAQLRDMAALGADLAALGFTAQELARALSPAASTGLTNEDHVPDVAENAVTRLGDIWCAGEHRLSCGSCTDDKAVATLFDGVTPHLMVTDPPYGVDYDPAWRHRAGVNQSAKTNKIRNDKQADWEPTWALFPGHIAYVWHGALHATTVAQSLVRQGFDIRSQIIWAKERLVIGRGDYHWQHEPCWYAVRKKGNWTGDRKQTTLWTISSGGQDAETPHSTQKPVECMRRPMQNNSAAGQPVYDPFLGSGTTLIAAEGRVCFGMELEARFVDVAVRRWEAFTGKEAKRLSDNKPFKIAAAEAAVSGSPPDSNPPCSH